MRKEIRLNRFLAQCGIASRRAAEEFILKGLVTVNGQKADHPGVQVDAMLDTVCLRGRQLKVAASTSILLHKPKGVICTRSDPQKRKTIYDLLPKELSSQPIQSVGRLDFDSSGIMILTSDGDLHRLLEHPSSNIERVYQVKAVGELTPAVQWLLCDGVEIDGKMAKAVKAELLLYSGGISRFMMTLLEGRNREVRKLCEGVGLKVLELKRISYGPFNIVNLPIGKWRYFTLSEDRLCLSLKQKYRPRPRSKPR